MENDMIIDVKNGVSDLFFSDKYYSKEILLEVCSEFAESLYFLLSEKSDGFNMKIIAKDDSIDFKEAVLEFLNYVLGVQVSRLK